MMAVVNGWPSNSGLRILATGKEEGEVMMEFPKPGVRKRRRCRWKIGRGTVPGGGGICRSMNNTGQL